MLPSAITGHVDIVQHKHESGVGSAKEGAADRETRRLQAARGMNTRMAADNLKQGHLLWALALQRYDASEAQWIDDVATCVWMRWYQ
jgi:hypothetical protein